MRLAFIFAAASLSGAIPAYAVSGVLGRAPAAKACFERVYDAVTSPMLGYFVTW